jgi:hypothetical protein
MISQPAFQRAEEVVTVRIVIRPIDNRVAKRKNFGPNVGRGAFEPGRCCITTISTPCGSKAHNPIIRRPTINAVGVGAIVGGATGRHEFDSPDGELAAVPPFGFAAAPLCALPILSAVSRVCACSAAAFAWARSPASRNAASALRVYAVLCERGASPGPSSVNEDGASGA